MNKRDNYKMGVESTFIPVTQDITAQCFFLRSFSPCVLVFMHCTHVFKIDTIRQAHLSFRVNHFKSAFMPNILIFYLILPSFILPFPLFLDICLISSWFLLCINNISKYIIAVRHWTQSP